MSEILLGSRLLEIEAEEQRQQNDAVEKKSIEVKSVKCFLLNIFSKQEVQLINSLAL